MTDLISTSPEDDAAATSATAEANRRNRAHQLADDVRDLVEDIVLRLEEMSLELDLTAEDILALVQEPALTFPANDIAWHAWAQMFPDAALKKGMPMERVIGRLFAEAPKLEDASGKAAARQALALPQAMVVLKCGMSLQGAMSTTPEGTLRVMTPSKDGDTARPIMVEQFFDYSDVSMIAVPREMPKIAGPSPIILARS